MTRSSMLMFSVPRANLYVYKGCDEGSDSGTNSYDRTSDTRQKQKNVTDYQCTNLATFKTKVMTNLYIIARIVQRLKNQLSCFVYDI